MDDIVSDVGGSHRPALQIVDAGPPAAAPARLRREPRPKLRWRKDLPSNRRWASRLRLAGLSAGLFAGIVAVGVASPPDLLSRLGAMVGMKAPVSAMGLSKPVDAAPRAAMPSYFRNCAEARRMGYQSIPAGEPAYRPALDDDHDGFACEPYSGHLEGLPD